VDGDDVETMLEGADTAAALVAEAFLQGGAPGCAMSFPPPPALGWEKTRHEILQLFVLEHLL